MSGRYERWSALGEQKVYMFKVGTFACQGALSQLSRGPAGELTVVERWDWLQHSLLEVATVFANQSP